MKHIKLQQYIPSDSYIHHLQPQIKLMLVILNLWIVFAVQSITALAIALFGLFLMLLMTKVPWKNYFVIVKRIRWLLLFLITLNLIFLKQGVVLFSIGSWSVYTGAIEQSIQVGFQLIYMMLTAAWFMYTTTPLALISGLEWLLIPVKKLGIKTEKTVLVLFIIFRYIPILFQDFEELQFAQASRGAHIYQGSLFQRMQALPSLLVPLFETALFHAQQNAKMLLARKYDNFHYWHVSEKESKKLIEILVIAQNLIILIGVYWFNYQGFLL
ncbi:MAG: energy-coupling factor transporter transmembrane component T family protein [Culicoidibacterales bacterium]